MSANHRALEAARGGLIRSCPIHTGSPIGTNRTNRATLMMSDVRRRPEVAGRLPKTALLTEADNGASYAADCASTRNQVRVGPMPRISMMPRSSKLNVFWTILRSASNLAWQAVRFHTGGHVYRVAPDVVGKSGVTDDACCGATGMQPDPYREVLATQCRKIGLGSLDR
jgi:hypothetical protein